MSKNSTMLSIQKGLLATAAVLSLVMSGTALYKVSSSAEALAKSTQVSEQAIDEVARLKPWALSQEALVEVLRDINFSSAVNGEAQPEAKVPLNVSERRYGDPAAQFTLIEYSDFECPACKAFYEVPKTLVDGSRGNISLIFKHVPIHGEASRKAAFAAECAAHQGGNDAFYKMASGIFDETQSNGAGTQSSFTAIARRIGLDGPALAKCIDDNLYYEKVKADFKEAVDKGVKVTPTTIIRYNPTGQQVDVGGAVSPEDILKAMSQLIQNPKGQK
jgi:protein-disulfide isomerase